MNYTIESWRVSQLIELYEEGQLNLNPEYQRKDIWSLPAKKKLIDTIIKGMPLPAFFLHRKDDSSYDMVDGQQRTRAILGYRRNIYPDLNGNTCEIADNFEVIDNFQIPIIAIENVTEQESIEDVYFRVNKYGEKPNRPEIIKSEHFDNPLQILVEELIETESFTSLNLFTESRLKRMADIDLVGELLTLLHFGITDKKKSVDRFYSEIKTNPHTDLEPIRERFIRVITLLQEFNNIHPLRESRLYQRNDFYTYFGFLDQNLEQSLSREILNYQYRILVTISPDILPSSNCFSFQEYTRNCITQSNSSSARTERLNFFNALLLNQEPNPNYSEQEDLPTDIIKDVIEFYELSNDNLNNIEEYFLIDYTQIDR